MQCNLSITKEDARNERFLSARTSAERTVEYSQR